MTILIAAILALLSFAEQTVVSRGSAIMGRTCVGACIHVTRTTAVQWRIVTPVTSAPDQNFVAEWRVDALTGIQPQSSFGYIWELGDVFGRDQRLPAGDIQLSAAQPSVYEGAWKVGVQDAPSTSFDFSGGGHSAEMLSADATFVLDGVDITNFSVGTSRDGQSFVITQPKSWILPLNADGSTNLFAGSTGPIMGTSTMVHTFTTAGMKVDYTKVMNAGYQGYTCYAAMLPASSANFNRVQINGTTTYTPVADGSTQFLGTQVTAAKFWHTAAHHFAINLTLPSGGPSVPSDWSHAATDNCFLVDGALNPKFYCEYVTSQYASRINTGSTVHQTQYSVSYQ